jgi:N-acetylmuramoyl-L-alanine amidase
MITTTRIVNLIVVHCSDSDNPDHDDISVIDQWHRARGWSKVGYHYFIKRNGKGQKGRFEYEVGSHVEGHNAHSIGICLSGKGNFTEAQYEMLYYLVHRACKKYNLDIMTAVVSHNSLNPNKTCPNFDVKKFLKERQV